MVFCEILSSLFNAFENILLRGGLKASPSCQRGRGTGPAEMSWPWTALSTVPRPWGHGGGCWWMLVGGGEDDLCPQQRCFRWHASSETTLQAMLWVCSLATLGRLVQTTFHQPRQKGGAAADCLDASAVLIMLWRSWGALGWLIALGHHFSASSLHTTYKNSQGPQAGPLQGLVTFHPRSDHFVASMEPPHLHVSVGEAVW